MTPAHQGLKPRQIHIAQSGDGLVVHLNFIALQGTAQLRFKGHEFTAIIAHRRREELNHLLAAALGFIKGDGRILHELFGG